MSPPTRRRVLDAGYGVGLMLYTVFSLGWLAVGAVVAAVNYSPALRGAVTAAARSSTDALSGRVAAGLLAATGMSEPLGQAILDYTLSGLNLTIAAALFWLARHDWTARLLVIALLGSAGAFNLQAHTAPVAVQTAFGVNIDWWHDVFLHGLAGLAYVAALLVFPTGRFTPTGDGGSWLARGLLGVAAAGAIGLLAISTADYPHTTTFIVYFGLLTPLAGIAAQLHRARQAPTPQLALQSRLLSTALVVAFGIAVVLGLLTLLLQALDTPGLTLYDPTARTPGRSPYDPTALVFWLFRLVFAAIPCALLITLRRSRLWDIERLFSRALGYGLLVVGVGAIYVVVVAAADAALSRPDADPLTETLATVAAALLFQPVRRQIERLTDRLLYGRRPRPYTVLAQVTALSHATASGMPDLTQLAEAIASGLGATFCRITLNVPGGTDHHHTWRLWNATISGEQVPVLHRGETVGAITLDRATIAGLTPPRRQLLDDLTRSSGLILHNARLAVELRQRLHAVSEQAEAITASRQRIAADAHHERRRIERDLHDGAQPHLIAMRMTLGLAEHHLATGSPQHLGTLLAGLVNQLDHTQTTLLTATSGLYPASLADRGITAALQAHLATLPFETQIQIVPTRLSGLRFCLATEAAVYFSCLEAIQNATKHAPDTAVRVHLTHQEGLLHFAVTDQGPGFDPEHQRHGRGLDNMTDRIATVGGHLTIDAAPGQACRRPWGSSPAAPRPAGTPDP